MSNIAVKVPKQWQTSSIGGSFDVNQGKQLSAKTSQGDNQKSFLRTSNVLWGRLDLADLDKMNFTDEECKRLALKKNDVLVCEGGDIGRTAIWNDEVADCYYQNHLHRLRAKDGSVNPKYFMYWMYYAFVVGRIYFGLGNKTTIPNLSQGKLKVLEFPVPATGEQSNIAVILSKIQEAIESQENIIKTTAELKAALMKKIFGEGLNGEPLKQTEIGKIPKSWEAKRIGDVFNFTSKPRQLKQNSQIPFMPMELIPISELYVRDFIYKDKVTSGTYIENGDLLIAKITPSFENGKQAIAQLDFDYAYATTEVIPVKGIKGISSNKYLYYYLLIQSVRNVLAGKMEGSTGRQRLSKTILEETIIPMPKLEEQQKITDIFESLDKKIFVATKKKNALTDLFKSMLDNLMSGEIRVNNLTL